LTAEEAVGQSIAILIPPDRLAEEPKILDRLKRGERVESFETLRVRKDGSIVNVSLAISPVKTFDGRIVGASKVARDITEKVRQDEALREANAALQRANADLQQFAYSASHDLQVDDESWPIGEIDAGEVLKKTLLNLEVTIKDSGASVTSTRLPRIRMHEFELGQVLQNLIGNAITYGGEMPPRVAIAAERQGEQWIF